MTDPSTLTHTVSLALRWADTDALGHIYHGTQISLIEEARTPWLNRATATEGLWPHVVARVAIDFRAPLDLGDGTAEVTCVGVGVGRSSVRTRETIRSPAGAVIAEAESVVVAWDEAERCSRALTPVELERLHAAIGEGGPT